MLLRSMADKKQILPTEIKDVEWLKKKLVVLLEDAAAQETPDHQACAKYADLLYKMLPKGNAEPSQKAVDMVRKALIEGKQPE